MAKELCTGWFHIVAGTVRKTLILTFHCSPAFLQQENWSSTICIDTGKCFPVFVLAQLDTAWQLIMCCVQYLL